MGVERTINKLLPTRIVEETLIGTFTFDGEVARVLGENRSLSLNMQLVEDKFGVDEAYRRILIGAAVDLKISWSPPAPDGSKSGYVTHFAERKPHFVSEILQ